MEEEVKRNEEKERREIRDRQRRIKGNHVKEENGKTTTTK